jgi:hypothetical protein
MRRCNERGRKCWPIALGIAALAVAMAGVSAESQSTASVMSKYVDTGFGFSFWYPTAWTVTQEPVADPTDGGWFRGGTIVRRLRINEFGEDGPLSSVDVEELSAPRGFLIVQGAHSTNPAGADQRFFFDQRTHIWMDALLSKPPEGGHRSTRPAALWGKTMGGLPILAGAGRGDDVIVPMDSTHLLVLTTMDSDEYERYVAETIVANGADGRMRGSTQIEKDAIHREALKLGVVGQPAGYLYKDSEHVYDSEGKVLPDIDPRSFALLSERGPNARFATDGVHVYDSSGVVIPGVDPQTFVATNLLTARDAHHTYDWNDGKLKIDRLAAR